MKDSVGWLRTVFHVLRDAVEGYSDNGDSMLGGAIAFFVMLSAAPLLVIAVGLAGLLFGMEEARTAILSNVRQFVSPDAARFLLRLMREAREPVTGGVAAVLGVIVLLFGASRLFVHLQRSLNYVMGVRVRRTKGIKRAARSMVQERVKSFAMVLACGAALTLLLLVRTAITALDSVIDQMVDIPRFWNALELLVSFSLFAVLIAAIYKVIPDVYLSWRDVWLGGVVTALLLGIGTLPIGWLLARVGNVGAYGAAGTLAAVLLFAYYASQIFFLGAEITAAWARRCGSGVRPRPYAVRVVEAQDDQAIPPV